MTTISPAEIWEQTLQALRGEIDEESYGAWLAPVRFERYGGGELTLGVPSVFFRNWLASNYQEQIETCFERFAREAVSVRYVVETGDGYDPAQGAETTRRSPFQGRADSVPSRQGSVRGADLSTSPLNPDYSFEKFVVGESNRFAYAAAQAVADPESQAYNPLLLYGGVGLGKTHLMHAIGQQMLGYGSHLHVLYISSEVFMNAFIEAIQRKDLSRFRNCFRRLDLLLIDDVQFFAGAERSQTEFFHTFNALFDAGKKIVISSDHPPKELTELEVRLRSRFEAGLIVDIQPPDLETRVAILLRKSEDHGLDLTPEVAIYIAERIKTNIRQLEGALKKLKAHSEVDDSPISIETSRDVLGNFFAGEEPVKISVEKIQLVVCKFFEVHLHDLTGPNRSRKFAYPRQIAAYLSREMTNLSYPEIARKFGGRDHTSIIHSYRKIEKEVQGDLNKQNLVKYLTKLVKEDPLLNAPK